MHNPPQLDPTRLDGLARLRDAAFGAWRASFDAFQRIERELTATVEEIDRLRRERVSFDRSGTKRRSEHLAELEAKRDDLLVKKSATWELCNQREQASTDAATLHATCEKHVKGAL